MTIMKEKAAAVNGAPLTITRIAAENILKFEQFKLEHLDKLTKFRGPNDVGKTTALKLLSLAVKGAVDPQSVIHDGAKKGEIILDFAGYKLRRAFTEKGQYLSITDDDGRTLPHPQQWVNDRIGEFRDFNPLAWLSLPAKEQIAILLRAIDVRLTAAEFTKATGMEPPIGVNFDQHGLLVIDALRDHFAEERKIENRTADQKKKAAAEGRAQLPSERPVVTAERRAEAAHALDDARTAKTKLEARKLAAANYAGAVARIESGKQRERDERARLGKKIEILRAEIASLEAQQHDCDVRAADLDQDKESLAGSAPPTAADIEAVNVSIRRANELSVAIQTDEKALARFVDVDALEQGANDAAARSTILDDTIDTIRGELRTGLLAKAQLPVGSLAIENDVISVDGHPLEHVAESQQIRVALAIARSLNPKLKVIILDGAERLDAKTFATFLKETRGDGFRYFAAEVDRDGTALEIISFGEDGVSSPAVAEVA